jgi:hypothetical protein
MIARLCASPAAALRSEAHNCEGLSIRRWAEAVLRVWPLRVCVPRRVGSQQDVRRAGRELPRLRHSIRATQTPAEGVYRVGPGNLGEGSRLTFHVWSVYLVAAKSILNARRRASSSSVRVLRRSISAIAASASSS